jgi:hypothetical protein
VRPVEVGRRCAIVPASGVTGLAARLRFDKRQQPADRVTTDVAAAFVSRDGLRVPLIHPHESAVDTRDAT